MGNYTGNKCLSCGEVFKDDDDVVVCPECGTPYHRECYLREGDCINTELHEKQQSWKPEEHNEGDEEEKTATRCMRCGFENSPEKLFCEKCGTPLMKTGDTPRPFNTVEGAQGFSQDGTNENQGQAGNMGANGMPFGAQMVFDKNSVVDGIKLDDYAKYIGRNPLALLSNFIRFSKFGGKCSLNVFAFLFPEVYFLFRKMKPWGVIALVLTAILGIPNAIEYLASGVMNVTIDVGFDIKSQSFTMISYGAWYLTIALKIFAGLFANFLYFRQAKKDITQIREEEVVADEETVKMKIMAKGGTSWAGVIVGFTVYAVIMFGAVMGISKLF